MTLGRRPSTHSRRSAPRGGGIPQGTPPWLVFMLGVALVFGSYYVWTGVQDYFSQFSATGQETQQAETTTNQSVATPRPIPSSVAGGDSAVSRGATANPAAPQVLNTPGATLTPIPECTPFRVIVTRSNVRISPNTEALRIDVYEEGREVCVINYTGEENDWVLIDTDPNTRRINEAYIFAENLEAIYPTLTPSQTYTPAPSVTPMPTLTPSLTPTLRPTRTIDPDSTDTPTPSPTITPTLPLQSA